MAIKRDSYTTTRKNIYKRDETIKTNIRKTKNSRITKQRTIEKENIKSINSEQVKKISKTFFGIFCAIIIFSCIVWGSIGIYNYALQSDYFNITEIEYKGNKILTKKDLRTITNLEIGKNILRYEINQIELSLLQNPWIDHVIIKRTLPSKISIDIVEKEPIFWATKDEKLYYLDKHLNFITEVSKETFLLLPTINIKYGTEEAINYLPDVIDAIQNIELPFSLNDILWLSINHAKGYEMYIEKQNLNLSIAIHNWKENIQNLADVIADLENRNEISKIKEIRAAHNQVTVIKN